MAPRNRDEQFIFSLEDLSPVKVRKDTRSMSDKEITEALKNRNMDTSGTKTEKRIRLEAELLNEGAGSADREFRRLEPIQGRPSWLENAAMRKKVNEGIYCY